MTNKLFRFVSLLLCLGWIVPASAQIYDNEPATIKWEFNSSSEDPAVVTPADAFTLTSFYIGDNLTEVAGKTASVWGQFVGFKPNTKESGASDANAAVWNVTPAKGFTFTPTKVHAKIARFGTDGGRMDVVIRTKEGQTKTLATGLIPPRDNKETSDDKHGADPNYAPEFTYEINDPAFATAQGFELVIHIYDLSGKEAGVADVQIEGTVSGEPEGTVLDNVDASVLWAFNSSSEDPAVADPDIAFSLLSFYTGENLTEVAGKTASVWGQFVGFKPNTKEAGASDANAAVWNVTPAKGVTFTPTKVHAKVARFGTDGGKMDVVIRTKEGQTKTLATGLIPPRDNKETSDDKHGADPNYAPEFTYEINDPAFATTEGFELVIHIYDLSGKEAGVADVQIYGTVNGKTQAVQKYNFSAVAEPKEAGNVSVTPAGDRFDTGTQLTVNATRNFGYRFVSWTDAQGNVVSTEPRFTYTVNANTALTANFEVIPTFALDYTVEGGANYYMVQAVPAPTVIDERNMYEEGTQVELTATSNPILSFNNWSNGETASTLSITMNEDVTLTANYSAIDFIAGWDFYRKGASGRKADFASADNDAAALTLRDADGNSEGWLDKSAESGNYEGRPAAVNWRTYGLGKFYWQTMVNAASFTEIKLITAMVYNYNAYTKQNVEYSLDGQNWKLLGTITLEGGKNWTDASFDFPAECNNQATLYVRWISDTTSPVDGTNSNNDGIGLGASYITGKEALVDDGTAPVLVSFVPEEGAKTASINGKIVLTFDEKVKVKEGTTAKLNTSVLLPSVSGKTVMFEYKNLAYATDYKFELAAGSISDLTDNYLASPVVINFTTKTRPVVTKGEYDFIVPDNGSIVDAIAAAGRREDTSKRFRIFIKNGDYVIPAATDRFATGTDGKQYPSATTILATPNVSFIGESIDGVSFVNTVPEYKGGSHVLEGIGRGDVLQLTKEATGTYFQDFTMKSGMPDASGRNIVLNDAGDKTIMKNMCLWAYQDTYVSNNSNSRYYFEGGVLRGRTDFLCGKGDVYYNACELRMVDGGYLAVPSVPKKYGYIFKDCTITGDKSLDGQYTLGRPWGEGTPIALFIDTRMEIVPSPIGWADMGTNGHPARFAEYNSMSANGNPVDLSQRKTNFKGHSNNPVLTKAEAEAMTLEAVMGGDDDWDPASLAEQAPAPAGVKLEGNVLSWSDNDYVLLWAVVKNGNVVDFTTLPTYTVDDANATWGVRSANEMGGLGEMVLVGDMSGIDSVGASDAEVIETIFYNVEGMRVDASFKGFVIKVDILSDGTKAVSKTVLK